MFKAVFMLEDKGTFQDLRSAWLVIKYLTQQAIKKGEINWQSLESIWVEEVFEHSPTKRRPLYTFYELRDIFAEST